MTDERYPIGKFTAQASYEKEELDKYISDLEALPNQLENAVKGLSDKQLDTPYREGGWTVRQVIHHVADSHMSAYTRMKWALTEDSPLIKAYDEKAWAHTPETTLETSPSLDFLKALHKKWCYLMRNLDAGDLQKVFIHPDSKKAVMLQTIIATYAWHGAHHLAHITALKKKLGWN